MNQRPDLLPDSCGKRLEFRFEFCRAKSREIGLVHEVYPDAEFHDRVHAFARHLAGLPRQAVGIAKLAVDLCENTDPTSARQVEQIANAVLAFGDEHKQRVAEFNERGGRRPAT